MASESGRLLTGGDGPYLNSLVRAAAGQPFAIREICEGADPPRVAAKRQRALRLSPVQRDESAKQTQPNKGSKYFSHLAERNPILIRKIHEVVCHFSVFVHVRRRHLAQSSGTIAVGPAAVRFHFRQCIGRSASVFCSDRQ